MIMSMSKKKKEFIGVTPLPVCDVTEDQRHWMELAGGMNEHGMSGVMRELIQDQVDIAKREGIM